MLEFYRVGLLALILSEYGFRTRSQAVARFSGLWRPWRTVLRLAYWVALLLLAGRGGPGGGLLALLGGWFLLGELGALLLRWRMRADISGGRPHGAALTHLAPVFYAVTFPLLALGFRRLGLSGLELGGAFPAPALEVALGIVLLWCWATLLTVSVVDLARPAQVLAEEQGAVGAGELIGILERLVTFALVLSGALAAVGFVIAAKAAARFPEFKDRAFAEYFLIGTLTSVGTALLLGLALKPS